MYHDHAAASVPPAPEQAGYREQHKKNFHNKSFERVLLKIGKYVTLD
jgi:hypothetical protein